jgi:hypothetical protein
MLIATRTAMGVGVALIMPATLSIIITTFPDTERGWAIGIWVGTAAGGIILGPLVGGCLLDRFWWGSVFLINVPVVAVTLLAAWVLVGDSRDPNAAPLDPVGAALSISGLLALVYVIIEVPDHGWADNFKLGGFAAAVALLGAFIAWELRSSHPMLDVGVFADPRFSAASLSVALVFFAMTGVLFVLIQHLQFVLGYTPLQAGHRLLPGGDRRRLGAGYGPGDHLDHGVPTARQGRGGLGNQHHHPAGRQRAPRGRARQRPVSSIRLLDHARAQGPPRPGRSRGTPLGRGGHPGRRQAGTLGNPAPGCVAVGIPGRDGQRAAGRAGLRARRRARRTAVPPLATGSGIVPDCHPRRTSDDVVPL